MCVDATPPMSDATLETRSSSSYQARSTGARDKRERRDGQLEEAGVGRVVEPRVALGGVRQRQQFVGEQSARVDEDAQPALQAGVEEPPVLGDEQRGEHAERVDRQLVPRHRAERGGDDRHRARARVAQVVEADGRHAHGAEDPRDLGELAGAADPDGAMPLGGHALKRPEPLGGLPVLAQEPAVDLLAYLDQGPVRGDLTGVEGGKRGGEAAAQLRGANMTHVLPPWAR